MSKKVLVIGAGQFGMSLALRLAEQGLDVTVVDKRKERVDEAAPKVSRALVADGSDARVLESLDPRSFAVAVDAIGDESLEASILCAAVLTQVGIPRVVARVTSDVHARILVSLGVHQTVHPESSLAADLARRIAVPDIRHQLTLDEGAELLELDVPEVWVGQSLKDLGLRARHQINVVGLRRPGPGGRTSLVATPDPEAPLQRAEVAILLGAKDKITALMKEIS